MFSLLAFLLVLGILVFVHELGHFLAARRAGMAVEEFGFGFPPRIVGFQKVSGRWRVVRSDPHNPRSTIHDQTIYSFNWLPLGGFVRIKGENGGDTHDPQSFVGQPRWRRALVLIAGVGMNALLAMALFATVFEIGARQLVDDLPPGAQVSDVETTIVAVLDGASAKAAGFAPGDVVLSVNGERIEQSTSISEYVRAHPDGDLAIRIRRDGAEQVITVRPVQLPGTAQRGIGVQLVETGFVRYPLPLAVIEGVRTTGFVMVEIVRAIVGVFRDLLAARPISTDIAGPVGIAVLTGQVAALGIVHLLQFTAVLSANLALLNVLPFPALDGGRLFLLAIEAIRRRALAERVERLIHAAGFAVLIAIIALVTYRDLVTFGGGILSSFRQAIGV